MIRQVIKKINKEKVMEPSQYPVRKLIAVSGMSPQIVTETLYALATRKEVPFIPTEIHIITTEEGANNAELNLLRAGKDKQGWFNKLCQELDLPDIQFSSENIHIIINEQTNQVLADIRTPEDNETAASYITEFIREQSKDNNSALHVSIAGGRKTMGYYMGYALSLFGRHQDRLSHVLVSEEFEGNPEFYYPTRDGDIIFDTRNGKNKPLDPAKAKVILANIPFLRINNNEAKNTMNGFSFKDTIQATQELLQPPTLVIDLEQQLILANGHLIELQDQRFAFYFWILERQQKRPVKTPANEKEQYDYFVEFMDIYKNIKGEMGSIDKTDDAFDDGMKAEYIQQSVSRIKSEIEKQLGMASTPFIIKSHGRPATYTISVKPDNILYDTISIKK